MLKCNAILNYHKMVQAQKRLNKLKNLIEDFSIFQEEFSQNHSQKWRILFARNVVENLFNKISQIVKK